MAEPARKPPLAPIRSTSSLLVDPQPTPRGALSTGKQASIVVTAIAFIAAILELSHEISFIEVNGRVLGWSAAAMFLITLVQLFALRQAKLLPRTGEEWTVPEPQRSKKRGRTAYVRERRFKHGRLGYLLLPLAVLAIALPTTKATTLALAIASWVAWLWSRMVESELIDLQADLLAHNAAARAEEKEVARLQRATENKHPHAPVLSPCIDPHIATARRATVRRARRALISVTALASAVTMLAAWSATVSAITLVSCVANGHCSKSHQKSRKFHSAGLYLGSPAPKTLAKAKGSEAFVPTAETPCLAIPEANGVPREKVRELEALFTAAGSLGRAAAGCPLTAEAQSTPDGTLYWARGEGGGTTKSIAIVPPGYKNTIVIGPAVKPTEELIEEDDDVHGPETFPRYKAGPGEYYLLYLGADRTPAMLIGEHLDLRALHLLRPSVVTAWISTVRERNIWLWPSLVSESEGIDTFVLTATGERRALEMVRYDLSTHEAMRARVEESYLPEISSLTPAQVAYWAPSPAP